MHCYIAEATATIVAAATATSVGWPFYLDQPASVFAVATAVSRA